MPRLPVVSGDEAIRAFQRAGYAFDRQRGSHVVLWHPQRKHGLAVPVHGSRPLPPGTLRALVRQADLTVEEFVRLLRG